MKKFWLLILSLALAVTPAIAQNQKISQLTNSPAQSGDLIPIDRSGVNYSITPGSIISLLSAPAVNTLLQSLSGCSTATYQYVPVSGTCVAPSTGMSSATAPILDTSNVAQFQASLLNYSGANGNGTSDNSTAMTNACAANSEVWLPAGAYAFTSNYALPCPLHFGANATLVAPQGVTLSNVVVSSAPPNVQLFTLAAGATATDNMTRANENPMSDGGNWTVGSFAGITGSTSEAGQIVSNYYEPVTVSAASFAYVLWTGSGVFPADQCSEVTLHTASTGYNMAVVRGSTTDGLFYRIQASGLGASANSALIYQNHTTQTSLIAFGGGTAIPMVSGDKLKICAIGTTISGYLNGGQIASVVDTHIATGYPGIQTYGAGNADSTAQISAWTGTAITGSQAPGAVTMAASQDTTRPEWFGAAGNGSLGCASATDDTVPIQQATNSVGGNGGAVLFSPKIYKITQAEIINTPVTSWLTTNRTATWTSVTPPTILQCGQAGADTLDIFGISFASPNLSNTVRGLGFARAKAGTNPSAAIRLYGVFLTHLEHLRIFDSFYLTYQSYSGNSIFTDLDGGYTYGTPSGSTAYYYSSANGGSNSSICDHCWVSNPYYGTQPATDMTYYDFAVNSPASGGAAVYALNSCPADVHFIAPIWDGGAGQAVSLSGINATYCGGWQKLPSITIENLHATTNGTAPQIYIHNSSGVRIIGGDTSNDGMSSSYITVQIDGATAQGNLISGLKMEGKGTCIELTGGANDNTIANNSCSGVTSSALTTGFVSTGSTNNIWEGNNIWGYGTTGISFDSSSTGNKICQNIVDTTNIGTAYADASSAANFYCAVTGVPPAN